MSKDDVLTPTELGIRAAPGTAEGVETKPVPQSDVLRPKSELAQRYVPETFNCMYCEGELSGQNNAHERPTKQYPAIVELYSYCPVCQLEGHLAFVTPKMRAAWADVAKALAGVKAANRINQLKANRRLQVKQRKHTNAFRNDNKRLGKRIPVIGPREAFLVNMLFETHQEKQQDESPTAPEPTEA